MKNLTNITQISQNTIQNISFSHGNFIKQIECKNILKKKKKPYMAYAGLPQFGSCVAVLLIITLID
jgi:hypothetical protein